MTSQTITRTQTMTTALENIDAIDNITEMKEVNNNPTNIACITSDGKVDISSFTEEEKRKYASIAKTINVNDINSVVAFGGEMHSAMNRHSSSFLTAVRTNKAGAEMSALIDNLLSELSCVDVDELAPATGIKKVLRKIPILKHFVTSLDKILNKYDSVDKNIETIANKIVATRMVSLRYNNALQKMFLDNLEYIKQLEDLIVAAKIKKEEIDAQLNDMMAHSDQYESYKISDVQKFATNLDRRISDLITLHYVMNQSLPQIRLVQDNNLQTANKAQAIISTTIPLWRNQLSIAVALNNQKNSIIVQRKVSETTQKMMKTVADQLHQNSIDIAKENERGIIDIDTLRHTTEKLISTIREVKEIQEQGIQHRKEVEQEILKLGTELSASMERQIGNNNGYYLS